jgi:hypothetical protein
VEKYVTARQTTDDNVMIGRKDEFFMPDNKGKNKDTHS